MHDSLTGGLSALHIPRDGWVEINKLFQDPTIGITDDDPLVLKSVEDFENEMTGLSEAGVECSAAFDDLDYLGTTNKQHKKLQQCLVDLSEEVGLVIPAKQMVVSTIQIPVNPECSLKEYSHLACERGRGRGDERGGAGGGSPPARARQGGRDGGETDGWSPERGTRRHGLGNRDESDQVHDGDDGGDRRREGDVNETLYDHAGPGTGRGRERKREEERASSEGKENLKYQGAGRMPSPDNGGGGDHFEGGARGEGAGASADELLQKDYSAALRDGAVPLMDAGRGEEGGA